MYVLVHSHMPGLVKIGKTQRPTDERLAELSQHAGVPGDFVLAYKHQVADCDAVEQSVHDLLAEHRLPDKEFFQVPVQRAIEAILQTAKDRCAP